MLSRVADNLFWMSRYLERAEAAARLLDATLLLDLDLSGVSGDPGDSHWKAAFDILQTTLPADRSGPLALSRWAAFDAENPSCVAAYLTRSRNNARGIRGSLNPEIWRAINSLYWDLRDPEFAARVKDSPHDFFTAVEAGSHLFQGVCDATLPHDEGWQFIQIGKYLERADKTIRLLDVKFRQLHGRSDPEDVPLLALEWAGVLRACRAYDAFQRVTIGKIDPERVVAFLLLEPTFPRSVRFCLEAAANAVAGIEAESNRSGELDRLLGRVLADLRFAEMEILWNADLPAFLSGLLHRCNQISRSVQDRYALVA